MNIEERIRLVRAIEKINSNASYANRIGVKNISTYKGRRIEQMKGPLFK